MATFTPRLHCFTLLFALAPLVKAQQAKPVALSAQAQQTLARLSSFETIDLKDWRYHLGDIPNGEDPTLDDSSWPTVTPIKKDLTTEAVWFRREITVPKQLNGYDLTNAEVEFHVAVGAAGPATLILYMDGRRVALGADLGSIVLWQKAHPGDHTLIAVKALASDVNKVFRSASLSIITDPARPSPGDFTKEITSDSWMLPAVPGGAAQAHVLEEAITAVNVKALEAGDNKAFDASLAKAQHILEPLRPLLQQANIHMVGNSHMDAAWMWPWTETVETVRQTLGTSLQLMGEYPQYTYTQSAAQYFEWIQDKYPVEFERIQRRVKEGRFELVGGMWIEPDLNIPSDESQVRQILIGKRYFQKNLGVDVRIGWNPDTFGYNWQLPQIYKKSGIDYFVTQKMQWNETNQLPLKLFWWQAPDGSRILTYFPHGYGNGTHPVDMAQDYAQASALNPGIGEMMHLYGVGDHGGGPTRMSVNQAEHWQQPDKIYPHLEFGTAQSFFSNVEQHLDTHAPTWNYATLASKTNTLPQPKSGEIALPIWDDELYLEYHRGTYTTQAAQKSGIRMSEVAMLNAEKFSSLAWLAGQPYPGSELNDAWEKVLFNEFHDLVAGSGIADIYKDAQDDFRSVRLTTNQATTQALATLSSYIDTQTSEGSVPLLVFNSMAWKRTGLVEARVQLPTASEGLTIHDPAGHQLPLQILRHTSATNSFDVLLRIDNMPALGYEKLTASPAPSSASASSSLKASPASLENGYLRVIVDATTGCITSLYDKRSHFDSIATGACGNQLQAFHDLPKAWDAWNIDADFDTKSFDLGPARSVELIESGPLRSIIRVTHSTASSRFVQDITLYAGIDRVDVSNDFDWHEHDILLKAAFPLAASSAQATYEIPFGSIQRPTTRNNSYEAAKFEVPAIRWADLGDTDYGFSLLNNSKYGYDAKGNVLRLTLLRSTHTPDPNADQGPQHFVYALYPHAGSWQSALTERAGWDFNYPLEAVQTERHSGSLPSSYSIVEVSPANIVLTAMKKAEDSDALILRFYEWAGQPTKVTLHLPHNIASASSVNLMEQPDPTPVSVDGNTITTTATPYSINTIKVTFSGTGPAYWTHP